MMAVFSPAECFMIEKYLSGNLWRTWTACEPGTATIAWSRTVHRVHPGDRRLTCVHVCLLDEGEAMY